MPELDFTPVCSILAGPNGSGKSSTVLQWLNVPGEVVNADEFARLINPEKPEIASIAAARMVLKRLDELVRQRQNFSFETTLSSNQALHLMKKAKMAGFRVELVFVMLETVEMNILRVRQRVSQGGHDIPQDAIRRRFYKAFKRLPTAIKLSNESVVIDNSKIAPETLVKIKNGQIALNHLDEARISHVRVAEALSAALGMSTDAVFREQKYG